MHVILTKLNAEKHRLCILRPGRAEDSRDLETRSMLVHDLVHFAFESEAKIDYGFWGLLCAGASLADLYDNENPAAADGRLMQVENLVAPLQSLWHGRMPLERYLEHAAASPLSFVDARFVAAALERMRRLWGHWSATGFGATMRLQWPDNG